MLLFCTAVYISCKKKQSDLYECLKPGQLVSDIVTLFETF